MEAPAGAYVGDTGLRIKKAREKFTSIKKDGAGWVQEWGQAVDGLRQNLDVHPGQAIWAFTRFLPFYGKFDKLEELRKRIYGIDHVSEKFEKSFRSCRRYWF